jgi:hypothetical protein
MSIDTAMLVRVTATADTVRAARDAQKSEHPSRSAAITP